MKKRIIHIATGLGMGGAEMTLLNLLAHLDRDEFENEVISLSTDEPLGERIRTLGVPVHALGMKPSVPSPASFPHLIRILRRFRPNLIQTWMYHADLLGALAAPFAGNPPVVWNLRVTLTNIRELKPATRIVVRTNAFISHCIPKRIVCCAEAACEHHAAIGYDRPRMTVIPNGFDLRGFAPDPLARARLRVALGLSTDTLLIGMAARFHPQKDHHNFVQAAARLHADMPEVHFVLWGKDVDVQNAQLAALLDESGLRGVVHLLGLRTDVAALTAALDLATLTSAYGEAFPRVVGEAMACGVPCVATDVGDVASILGGSGRIVPTRDPEALAKVWAAVLQLASAERQALGAAGRTRVEENFRVEKMAAAYASLYRDIIAAKERR
jgi:glycosyltransferase involved in cell wall biosynthesis